MKHTAPVFGLMLLGGAALAMPAHAITCNSTQVLGQGQSTNLAGLSGGNCVQVSDKIFGDASVGGAITGQQGSAIFTFTANSVTVGFQGAIGPGLTGNIDYSVAIAPGFNFAIVGVEEDFNITSDGSGIVGNATLAGTANGTSFDCSRSTAGASSCPASLALASVTDVLMTQDITTDAHATVTGIQDTFIQQAIPEPSSLLILGGGLIGLGALLYRRRRRDGGGLAAA